MPKNQEEEASAHPVFPVAGVIDDGKTHKILEYVRILDIDV